MPLIKSFPLVTNQSSVDIWELACQTLCCFPLAASCLLCLFFIPLRSLAPLSLHQPDPHSALFATARSRPLEELSLHFSTRRSFFPSLSTPSISSVPLLAFLCVFNLQMRWEEEVPAEADWAQLMQQQSDGYGGSIKERGQLVTVLLFFFFFFFQTSHSESLILVFRLIEFGHKILKWEHYATRSYDS